MKRPGPTRSPPFSRPPEPFPARSWPPSTRTATRAARFKDGKVTTAEGYRDAYQRFVADGWNAVAFDPEYGGQGMPWVVTTALQEIWNSGSVAFAACPMLTQAAVEAIYHHGTEAQKKKYLPKIGQR